MANDVFGFVSVTLGATGAAVVGTPKSVSRVVLYAATANAGEVRVGDSAANCPFPVPKIAAGAPVVLPVHDLKLLFALSTNAGDKLEIAWFQGRR